MSHTLLTAQEAAAKAQCTVRAIHLATKGHRNPLPFSRNPQTGVMEFRQDHLETWMNNRRRNLLSVDDRLKVKAMKDDGQSANQIARYFKVSEALIYQVLKGRE